MPGQEFKIGVQKTSGGLNPVQLLDSVLKDLGRLIEKLKGRVHIVFDEFQEIEKAGAEKAEKTMRSQMQYHQAPYLVLGSRRHMLLNMFGSQDRAFYKMGFLLELKKLPQDELDSYIVERFKSGGKNCSLELAQKITALSSCHPYYTQKLSFLVYELSAHEPGLQQVSHAMQTLMDEESHLFASDIAKLSQWSVGTY